MFCNYYSASVFVIQYLNVFKSVDLGISLEIIITRKPVMDVETNEMDVMNVVIHDIAEESIS